MMNNVTKMAAAGVIGAVSLTAAPPAQSALVCNSGLGTCTELVALGPAPTEIKGGTISMPLFDSKLGTLTAANINIVATSKVKAGSSVTNFGGTPLTITVSNSITFSLADITNPGGVIDTALKAMSLIPTTGSLTFPNVPGFKSAPANKISIGPADYTDSEALIVTLASLQASGGGAQTLSVNTSTKTQLLAGGDVVAARFLNDALLELDITYFYNPVQDVPEPLSIGMMGVGLAGLGAAQFARRRKKSETTNG